jgi:SARP family transcriptional regulator, regulator of embCAB operon
MPPILPPPPRRTGRILLAGLLALVLLAGVAVAAVWVVGDRGGPRRTAATDTTTAATAPSVGPVATEPLVTEPLVTASVSAAPTTARPTASSSSRSGDPNLVGLDDFAGAGPDLTRWGLYDSVHPNGSVWSPSMVRVAAGELRVVGSGRNPTGAGNRSGGLCWCGRDGSRTYGKWQIRARFDAGAGYGQIIGLWPDSNKGADGWVSMDTPGADRHRLYVDLNWTSGTQHTDGSQLDGDFTQWHVYTFEWRAGFIKIQVDGAVIYDSTRTVGVVIPSGPMHLYMQQTIGPTGGVPPPNAQTPDEVVMHVDWVRIYR